MLTALCLAVHIGALGGCATPRAAPLLPWQPVDEGLPAARSVLAFAVDPADPGLLLAATNSPPQLWRSVDGGATWQSVGQELGGRLAHALLAAPDAAGVFLAGTSDGLFRSADRGLTWQAIADTPRPVTPPVGLERQGRSVYALLAGPGAALYLAGEDNRPWRSDDGGRTWQPLGAVPDAGALLALAVSPDGGRLLAGSDGAGLFRSADGGQTWQRAEDIPPTFVAGLWFDPFDGRIAYARTRAGLYRSADGGQSWHAVAAELDGRVDALLPGPAAGQALLLINSGQAYATDDGGRTWQPRARLGRPGAVYSLRRIQDAAGDILIAATHAGLWQGDASGSRWQPWPNGPGRGAVNDLALTADGALFAASPAGVFRSDDHGATWQANGAGLPPVAVLSVGAAPSNPQVLYAGTDGRGLYRSLDGGRSWAATALDVPSVPGVLSDPSDPDHVFVRAAFQRIYESRDGGATWRTPWDGLDLSTEIIALSPVADDISTLFAAGTDRLYRSSNAGQNWQPVAAELTGQTVFQVLVDPQDGSKLYAGATKGVYVSSDGGATWTPWGRGLEDVTVAALAFDPKRPQQVYAGSRYQGLWRSLDHGETWQPAGLAGLSVHRLIVTADGRWLLAATDQGLWRAALAGGAR